MESDAADLYMCEPPLFHGKAEFSCFSSSLLDPENLYLGNSLWSSYFGFISKLALSNTCQGQFLEPVSIYLCIHPSSIDGASKGSEVGVVISKLMTTEMLMWRMIKVWRWMLILLLSYSEIERSWLMRIIMIMMTMWMNTCREMRSGRKHI
ncbi:hypothetical protein RHGRI_017358 [Rhododendron griersonianum]|uniref:Uncharacterized protein n=1 Tax=Rhododendron griersonianum TaxID=479676 RepID=A0AAV6JXH0_9ERIC|nr:hypothetical protein RHGRI_017358 [Rhododendron griersonianum]